VSIAPGLPALPANTIQKGDYINLADLPLAKVIPPLFPRAWRAKSFS